MYFETQRNTNTTLHVKVNTSRKRKAHIVCGG
jgi:hypothetical protein